MEKILENLESKIDKLRSDLDSQYVDSIGKTRVVFIKNISIILSVPIRPLSLPLKTLEDIDPQTPNSILDFVKKYDLKISQVINANPRFYVKVVSGKDKDFFLIPIVPIDNFKVGTEEVEISIESDPLFTSETSELLEYRYQKKIVEYLKLYTLYYFINLGEPEFEIIKDHSYNIEALKDTIYLPGSVADEIIYDGAKIIVLSQKMADNLTSYLETQKANGYRTKSNEPLEKEITFSNKIDYYGDIYDYRHNDKFMLFDSTNELIKWFVINENKKKNTSGATQNFKVGAKEPYYYFNRKIHDEPVLIQPILGDEETLAKALSVVSYWNSNKINIGGNPEPGTYTIPELKNYNIINMEGDNIKSITPIKKKNKNFIIENNKLYYSVLIF